MPTYRILDQDGVIVDKSREPSDISNDHLIKMYKDMLSVSSKNVRGPFVKDLTDLVYSHGSNHVRCPKTRPHQLLHGLSR